MCLLLMCPVLWVRLAEGENSVCVQVVQSFRTPSHTTMSSPGIRFPRHTRKLCVRIYQTALHTVIQSHQYFKHPPCGIRHVMLLVINSTLYDTNTNYRRRNLAIRKNSYSGLAKIYDGLHISSMSVTIYARRKKMPSQAATELGYSGM